MNVNKNALAPLALLLTVVTIPVKSEPVSDPGLITSFRQVGPATYMVIDNTSVCTTNTFLLQGDYPGARQIVATALSAFMANKKVQIEIRTDTGCTGWGSLIMGVTAFQ